jgi:uncharacterized protein with GYD domain
MPKYLIKGNYSPDGIKGLLREGGSSRRETVGKMISSLGGKLEAFYFSFGQDDVYLIVDVPDAVTASAIGLTVNASGLVSITTTVLITPEEIDQASKKSISYRAPGT